MREVVHERVSRIAGMTAVFSSSSNATSYIVGAIVGLCALGWQDIPSQKALALIPWLTLALFGYEGWTALHSVASRYKVATVATCVLALIMFVNSAQNGFAQTSSRHLLASLVWLPISSLTLIALRSRASAGKALLAALVIGLFVAALTMIMQRAIFLYVRPLGINHNVLSGTLALVNLCAVLSLAQMNPRAFVLRNGTRAITSNAWVAAAIVAVIFVVVLSGARSPLLALSVAAIVLIALFGHHLRVTAVLIIALGALLVVALGYPRFIEITREAAAYVAGDHATSVGGRLDAWRWFSESGLAHPFLGHSPDAVKASLAARGVHWGVDPRSTIEMWHLHNDVLQLAAAYGLIAAACFVATLCGFATAALSRVISLRNSARSLEALVTPSALIAAILMIAVTGLTDSMTYWSTSWIGWGTAVAVLLAVLLTEEENVMNNNHVAPRTRMGATSD
jgi:O-antigen ligase